MIRRLIAFRFDRDPLVCRSHVQRLRELNPDVPIVGIFGGEPYKRAAFRFGRRLVLALDGFYSSAHRGRWNWMRGDLVLRAWFVRQGHELAFDVVHFIEWDLVVLEPLDRVYGHVPANSIGLTALTPLREIESTWVWTTGENRAHWQELLAWANTTWGYDDTPHACLGGGPSIPRAFLERYVGVDVPQGCMEELRYPLLAQIFGIDMVDTRLRRGWHDDAEDRVFNVGGPSIPPAVIIDELRRANGRRAFHPVRYRLDPKAFHAQN